MKYQIKFVTGELQDKVFSIKENALSIGRSHSNEIRLSSPDVSGHHVILTLTPDGIVLENLSSRETSIDNEVIQLGDRIRLYVGQEIKMGDDNTFILESLQSDDDFATADIRFNEGEKTSLPERNDDLPTMNSDSCSLPHFQSVLESQEAKGIMDKRETMRPLSVHDDDKTIAMQTRMASTEELDYLKGSHQRQKNKKVGIYTSIIIFFIGALFAGYWFFIHKIPEEFVSWPKNAEGAELSNIAKLKGFPWPGDIDLEYPCVKNTKIKQSPGMIEINTFLGKYQDVPFRMILEYRKTVESLNEGRIKGFEKWIANKEKNYENWNFDTILPLSFYQGEHGIPYLCAPYSRTIKNESFFGFAVYLRYEDWIITLLKEVPIRERWRAEIYIQKVCFFRFSIRFLQTHWEGIDHIINGSATENIAEAKALLLRRSPSVWEKSDLLLHNALIKSNGHSDMIDNYTEAMELLQTLRKNQTEWFNAQKIAYFRAKNRNEKKEQDRIRENLKAVFSSEEDLRFHKIRQNKWD